MLTNDLLRYEVGEHDITPRYLPRKRADYYLKIAEELIRIFKTHLGKSRHELECALDEYESDRVGYKIIRGLAKILEGFVEFQPADDLDYPEFRRRVFEFAEKFRPVVQEPDVIHQNVRQIVLDKFRVENGSVPPNLYGDLPEQQRLVRMAPTINPEILIRRYNLALAQGILYRCHRMEIKIWDGYKTVFWYLKLAQLMHRIYKNENGYLIIVDGPFSLFKKTQKYGVNLARFLPGLLLAQKWQMHATVNTERGERHFFLNQDCGLTSYYKKENPFDSTVEEAFYKNFRKRKTEWQIEREPEILDLGDTVLIPDFKLIHLDGTEKLLEIVGFWTPEYLEKKLDKLRRTERTDLIVAVNENLNCSRRDFNGTVIFYKTRLKVGEVLKILDEDKAHV